VILAAGTGASAASLLELGALFLGVAVLARVASRMGLSPIPLYLLAGLFIGAGSPFPLEASDGFIEVAATIGVVLLLFFLGLEYTPEELIANVRKSGPAGLVDLFNAVPGVAAALLLGWGPVAAFVMGGVTYISSSGVIAKMLRDLGRLGNRETPTILSVLVIEDLVMIIYLPVLAGLVAGGAAVTVGTSVAVGVALVAVVVILAARFGSQLSRVLFSRSDEVLLFTILGLTFLIAGASERIGVSSGVGAFLVGVALSGPVQRSAEALIAPLRDLFAAAFFIFFTYQIDPAALAGTAVAAVVLAVTSAATKAGTGWWAARRAGIGPAGRARTATTLIARGEFSIVIAGIAVANGIEPQLGALTATYVLILAIAGPVLARLSDRLSGLVARRGSSARSVDQVDLTVGTSASSPRPSEAAEGSASVVDGAGEGGRPV
jgi:CPA2 family monovalent cation:H+ antiporter-2